jgi:DNA-binding CsgD family transcriptional regulator
MAPCKPEQDNSPTWQAPPVIGPKLQNRIGEIHALWDELSDFGVDRTGVALKVCMERISGWLNAQDAFWIGAVHVLKCPARKQKDALSGWRVRAIEHLHPDFHDVRHNEKVVKKLQTDELGTTNIALTAGAGRFRAYALQSGHLVDVEAFQQTGHYDFYYRRWNIRDRIWVASPVNADTESYFCFDRIGKTRRHFDADDLALAAYALRGLKWFHRQLMLSHGLGLSVDPLTPAERRMIQCLLSGMSESEIAATLALSKGTVHQYATQIYQKFAVHGRVEFTALWLSGNVG